jgi:hypothetical protein
MSYPRFQRSRDFKFRQRTSADIIANSTSWTNLDTALDITLSAETGDAIECGVSFQAENEASTFRLDVGTLVSSAIVNYFGGAVDPGSNYGVSGWTAAGGVAASVSGSVMKTLVAGDLSAGTVTVRLRYRTDTAANKTIHAVTARPFQFWTKNLGPQDPN